VVPGWRYKFFVFLLRLMPRPLLHTVGLMDGAPVRKQE
jgi:hypothetical protein